MVLSIANSYDLSSTSYIRSVIVNDLKGLFSMFSEKLILMIIFQEQEVKYHVAFIIFKD